MVCLKQFTEPDNKFPDKGQYQERTNKPQISCKKKEIKKYNCQEKNKNKKQQRNIIKKYIYQQASCLDTHGQSKHHLTGEIPCIPSTKSFLKKVTKRKAKTI